MTRCRAGRRVGQKPRHLRRTAVSISTIILPRALMIEARLVARSGQFALIVGGARTRASSSRPVKTKRPS